MKLEHVKSRIKEYVEARNTPYAFYIGYNQWPNSLSQKWGKIDELDKVLDEVNTCENCIEGNLPIERLIIYSETQCMAFAKNELWNPIDYESEQSHSIVVIPYIAKDGWFGNEIVSERNKTE